MLANWLYLSVSNLSDGAVPAAVDQLLVDSRRRNIELGVTGALIFTGSHFAQLIEGPPDGIATLRAAIEQDARHSDIMTLQAGPIHSRQFADWTMAYSGRSTFVNRELRLIRREARRQISDAARNLMILLDEFSRAGGIGGAES